MKHRTLITQSRCFLNQPRMIRQALSFGLCLAILSLDEMSLSWAESLPNSAALRAETQANLQNNPPENWLGQSVAHQNAAVQFSKDFPEVLWWQQWGDPHLTQAIETALTNNPDLSVLISRLKQSKYQAYQIVGGALPSVNLNPSYNRQKNSQNVIAPSRQQLGASGPRVFAPGQTFSIYNAPIQATWEVDFWLKTVDAVKLEKERRRQLDAELKATTLILASEVATTYFQLVQRDGELEILKELIAITEDQKQWANDRLQAGLGTAADLETLSQRLIDFVDNRQALEAEQKMALHQLATLMGKTPAEVADWPRKSVEFWQQTLASQTQPVPSGLPSELLTRRPDIVIAEAQLAQQHIQIRLARKAFFPTLSLTGQYGFASTALDTLFKSDSSLWSLGGSATQGLFQGGQRWFKLKQEKALYEERIAQYQKAILAGFQDVEDALTQIHLANQAVKNQNDQLKSLETQWRYQQDQYQAGLVDAEAEQTAKQAYLKAKQQWVVDLINQPIQQVGLVKALGGGY